MGTTGTVVSRTIQNTNTVNPTNEDLFGISPDEPLKIIESDGLVKYYGKLLSQIDADRYMDAFLNGIEWQHDQAHMFGKTIVTKRKVAWYAEQPFRYTYSNVTKQALPWTESLSTLKLIVEQQTGETFNSCLLNLYHTGMEGMAWHSDAEKDLKKHGAIGSISLGATRKFSFKHKKNRETVSLNLQHGSLLVMGGATQDHWLHRLPPTTKISDPRINLTFRTIEQSA